MLTLAAMLSASAQSYKKLWEQANAHLANDLPRSALEVAEKMAQKAEREHNAVELLRASTVEYKAWKDIGADSAAASLERMEARMAAETRPVEHALWQSVLGRIYVQNASRYFYRHTPTDSAQESRGKALLRASVSDIDLLGRTGVKPYAALFEKGAESRYFKDDLLSALAYEAMENGEYTNEEKGALLERLIAYYHAAGNREAALLCELDRLKRLSGYGGSITAEEQYQRLRALAEEFRSLPLNGETYIALTELPSYSTTAYNDSVLVGLAHEGLELYPKNKRAKAALTNYIADMETPQMSFRLRDAYIYPGSPQTMTLRVRNTEHATVNIYRTDYSAEDVLRLQYGDWKDKYAKAHEPFRTIEHQMAKRPAYEWFEDKITFALNDAGIYVVEVKSEHGSEDYGALYVTRLRPMVLNVQGGGARATAVDAVSGAPLPQASIHAVEWDAKAKEYIDRGTFRSDAEGNIFYNFKDGNRYRFFLESGTDRYLPSFDYNVLRNYSNEEKSKAVARIFTDRGIYRPGQQVEFGIVLSRQHGDELSVLKACDVTVTLYDANGTKVDTLHRTTDDFGVAGGTFTLPEVCLPGTFRIHTAAQGTQASGTTTFRVEEYKRPTFTAEMALPDVAYKLGDSITVEGTAKTFTGLPVKSARVKYVIESNKRYARSAETLTDNGEAVTDEEGRFRIPCLLRDDGGTSHSYYWSWRDGVRFIRITADVTAENGETQVGTLSFAATNVADWIEAEWPDFICVETPKPVVIRHVGSGGRLLPGGGRYELWRNDKVAFTDTFQSGKSFLLPFDRLGSGTYKVRIYCGEREDRTNSFTLISEQDRMPFGTETLCHYERFSALRDSAFVMIGTPKQDVTLFCDLVAEGRIVESRRYHVSNELLHLNFAYKPEYGDAVTVHFAFLRDGTVYKKEFTLEKPRPDKRLLLSWTTFRSLLQPGQKEEWRLRVSHPDGTPAPASLMACLYDASLDQLAANPWTFGISFPRFVYHSDWQYYSVPTLNLSSNAFAHTLTVPGNVFTTWKEELFSGYATRNSRSDVLMRSMAGGAKTRMYAEPMPMAVAENMKYEEKLTMATADAIAEDDAAVEEEATEETAEVRTNFAETAFFHPALRTDKRGEVSLVFTLPESLTSWQFRAFAHDEEVRYGMLDAVVVARKDFMVEGNLPRFVRDGDRAVIPATLRNLSDGTEQGTVRCRLLDAATEKVLGDWKQSFTVDAGGEQTFHFPFDVTGMPAALIVRLTAQGRNFSDGEERLLPVLSSRERVLRTAPFALNGEGTLTLRIDTLFSKSANATEKVLSVETSSNPAWYAVAELPVIANYECYSATSWATRYYALSLARHVGRQNPEIRGLSAAADKQHAWADLLKRNPDLKQTLLQETPWVADAEDETARVSALADLFDEQKQDVRMQQTLKRLDELQTPDGAWTWFPGMEGSKWVTTEVAVLLARQQGMTGNTSTRSRLDRAVKWLEKEAAKDVKDMKKLEKREKTKFSVSEQQLKYLYLRALLGLEADKDTRYLLKRFSEPGEMTMYEKAMTMVVQAHYGMEKEALMGAQSLLEHTVSTPAMGRWFDTDRALWCWNSYKMPTQTAAIEALYALRDKGDFAAAIEEMKLWVIQSKRTQDWEMLRATTDAIYCLLQTSARPGAATPLEASGQKKLTYELLRGGRTVARSKEGAALSPTAVGYSRTDYADAATLRSDAIRLERKGDGLAWGAVFARYSLPAAEIPAASSGLSVSRRLEVRRGGAWIPLSQGEALHVGDRLRQVFTLTADRDYDFVSLRASRAACMEPVEALSGYTYRDGIGFYRVVRDASSEYFFETFRKGTRTFTEECFVDRVGTYTLGTAKIQSQYAPEFCGQTRGDVVTVE